MLYPVPTFNHVETSELAYWEDFLSKEDIDVLLGQPEWEDMRPGLVGSLELNKNSTIRSSKVAWLSPKDEMTPIWEKMADTVAEVNSRFFRYDLTGFYEPMQLTLYTEETKDHYGWHIDASYKDRKVPRKLSMVLLLSSINEFEGGELQVKINSDEETTLDCRKGRAWFFPSYMLHRVKPVTKGTRKSLVLWVGGPPFK